MGIGPVVLLDKSAFQALSRREYLVLDSYTFENLAPILVLEVLGDLTKQYRDGTVPEAKVQELALKFGGSGPAVNVHYQYMCAQSLLGADIPMQGKCIPGGATTAPLPEGGYGMLVDLTPINRMIMKLADGRISDLDVELSRIWRANASGLTLNPLNEFANKKHLVIPRAASIQNAANTAAGLIDTGGLQVVWLEWLVESFAGQASIRRRILERWARHGIALRTFAPYAHFCLRALLTLFIAWRNSLVRWGPTNLLDLQYLYYLPFCEAFVSDDRLHRALAPVLVGEKQRFVPLSTFKATLRATADFFDAVPDPDRGFVRAALGGYPPPLAGSILHELWAAAGGPWSPAAASRTGYTAEQVHRGVEYVQRAAAAGAPGAL
jgi:hypothetical protein